MTTTIVVLTTSVRVGQETCLISRATSRQNWRTPSIQPRGLATSDCSFVSSVIAAAPSRVLDVAIVFTSIAGDQLWVGVSSARETDRGIRIRTRTLGFGDPRANR